MCNIEKLREGGDEANLLPCSKLQGYKAVSDIIIMKIQLQHFIHRSVEYEASGIFWGRGGFLGFFGTP